MTDEKLCPDCDRERPTKHWETDAEEFCQATGEVNYCTTLTVARLRAENARLSEEVARLKGKLDGEMAESETAARLVIENLENQLYAEGKKWIRCEERMPERRTRVWFFSRLVRRGWFMGEDFASDSGFGFTPGEVSHWMTCENEPEPPK